MQLTDKDYRIIWRQLRRWLNECIDPDGFLHFCLAERKTFDQKTLVRLEDILEAMSDLERGQAEFREKKQEEAV